MKKLNWVLVLVLSLAIVSPVLAADKKPVKSEKFVQAAQAMVERLEKAVKNLDTLMAQVKTRANAMSAKGKDVSQAVAKFPAADLAIDAAKTSLAGLKTKLADLNEASSTPRTLWQADKKEAQKVVAQIKEAHKTIVDAIRELKPKAATSTASTTKK